MKPFNNKGELQLIGMGVGLVTLIILGFIAFPVISGVDNAVTLDANSTLGHARANYSTSVAGALTLFGVSPIVYAAAIVLVILVVYLVRK